MHCIQATPTIFHKDHVILDNLTLKRFSQLIDNGQEKLIIGGLTGIEKENLRLSQAGFIAQTPHPENFGAALTHASITTDYSEALMEFITPPFSQTTDSLNYLNKIHQFVYDHLPDEFLLAASMPCGIDGDRSIPIAQYGSSNIGQMKHIYRQGLGHRYGRTMQAIAGIHFNYSIPEPLWPALQTLNKNPLSEQDFIAEQYFNLIRNFLNQGWLLLYLFGASPAICKNFFKDRPLIDNIFESFDDHTLYLPYATSLRMSDIGYKSNNKANLEIDYNSLSGYVNSLTAAIETPYADYKKIGLKNNGEYRQLNTNILQIENEFYNTIRPKQISASGEKPTLALQRRGIKYVEIRSLDLDIYQPTGIETNTAHFLEAFLLTCLFQESPKCNKNQQHINNNNLSAVAHEGRRPDLLLDQNDKKITLNAWALNILESMTPICQTLDHGQINTPYQKALNQQINCIQNPDLTPSAKILTDMRKTQQPFARFAIEQSRRHEHFYRNQQLNKEESDRFTEMSIQSKKRLAEIETNDHMSFDDFLAQYFQQQ